MILGGIKSLLLGSKDEQEMTVTQKALNIEIPGSFRTFAVFLG